MSKESDHFRGNEDRKRRGEKEFTVVLSRWREQSRLKAEEGSEVSRPPAAFLFENNWNGGRARVRKVIAKRNRILHNQGSSCI